MNVTETFEPMESSRKIFSCSYSHKSFSDLSGGSG